MGETEIKEASWVSHSSWCCDKLPDKDDLRKGDYWLSVQGHSPSWLVAARSVRQLVTLDPPPGNKRMLFLGSHSPFLFRPGIQPTGRHCLPLGCVCPVHLNLSGNPNPAQPRGVSHQRSKRSLTVRSLMRKELCQSHSTGLTVTISKDLTYKKRTHSVRT